MYYKIKGRKIVLTAMFAGALFLAGCDSGTPTQTPATIQTATAIALPTNSPSGAGAATADTAGTASPVGTPTAGNSGSEQGTATADCTRLNLNSTTDAELIAAIPGFSARMVREFMEYRPYVSIQQFRKEIGKYVNAATIAEYEKYVYVPVDPNASDADSLQQIPGVDSTIAADLIAARPYASETAFLDALGKKVSAEQKAAAMCYMAANP